MNRVEPLVLPTAIRAEVSGNGDLVELQGRILLDEYETRALHEWLGRVIATPETGSGDMTQCESCELFTPTKGGRCHHCQATL